MGFEKRRVCVWGGGWRWYLIMRERRVRSDGERQADKQSERDRYRERMEGRGERERDKQIDRAIYRDRQRGRGWAAEGGVDRISKTINKLRITK